MNKRLQELPLFRPVEQKSSYCGTDVKYLSSGTLTAEVQPISDTATAELYGVNVIRSVLLLCAPGAAVMERCRVEINGDMYEVKGVTRYTNYTKAGAEKV
ncbi:MAG: hypothetical protein J6A19_15460 [Oscillospiraceae bacterium]|nr:hypothetical protein [Oscillospiraceae bacterium]